MTMHFPTSDDPALGHAASPRRVWQRFDDGVVAGLADDRSSEPPPETDLTTRALNAPITWYDGDSRRIGREQTQEFITAAEAYLETNIQLLEQLPGRIAEQQQVVDEHNDALAAANQRVADIVLVEERAWLAEASARWQPPAPSMIIQNIEVITADRWLNARQCRLGDTVEWRRKDVLERRHGDATSTEARALKELLRLNQLLAQARIQHSLVQSRLYSLRENLEWWRKEELALEAPPPSSIPRDPALRAHLLELQKSGRLPGTLSFTA